MENVHSMNKILQFVTVIASDNCCKLCSCLYNIWGFHNNNDSRQGVLGNDTM